MRRAELLAETPQRRHIPAAQPSPWGARTNRTVAPSSLCLPPPQSERSFQVHEVKIPEVVYTGSGEGLFDFLATELKAFIQAHPPSDALTEE